MLYSSVVHKNERRSTLLLTDLYGHSDSRKTYLINIIENFMPPLKQTKLNKKSCLVIKTNSKLRDLRTMVMEYIVYWLQTIYAVFASK